MARCSRRDSLFKRETSLKLSLDALKAFCITDSYKLYAALLAETQEIFGIILHYSKSRIHFIVATATGLKIARPRNPRIAKRFSRAILSPVDMSLSSPKIRADTIHSANRFCRTQYLVSGAHTLASEQPPSRFSRSIWRSSKQSFGSPVFSDASASTPGALIPTAIVCPVCLSIAA
jgi:hypothetical protein